MRDRTFQGVFSKCHWLWERAVLLQGELVGLGEGPLVFISDKLPGVADAAGCLLFSSKKRIDWILSVRKFPETIVSRMHLEMVLTLRGCIWDLEDERKAVLMFKILSRFKILKKKVSFTNKVGLFLFLVYILRKWVASCGIKIGI